MKPTLVIAALSLLLGMPLARAETQSVIDPTEGSEPSAPPAAAVKKSARPDPDLRRERQRAAEEQRKRAQAEARAAVAERESERLRAAEQARQQAEAAAARKAVAAREAERRGAVRAAASLATAARIASEQEAVEREAAARASAARELAAREAATREAAAKEMRQREAATRTAQQEELAKHAQWKRIAPRELRPASTSAPAPAPARTVGAVFRDCADCPEMVWLPPGDFVMGEGAAQEGARPQVSISYKLAVGRFEVTFREWDACAEDGGCRRRPHDAGWGRGGQPVINVSWTDAQQYTQWLSRKAGRSYRLLTEAEWEYAAKSGTDARYWWGNHAGNGEANCFDCGSKWDGRQAAPVGRFAPNPFGLYDMHGNVSEWVEDCYRDRYKDVPADGKAWTRDCSVIADARTLRGGAWRSTSRSTRSTARSSAALHYFDNQIGFRVARTD